MKDYPLDIKTESLKNLYVKDSKSCTFSFYSEFSYLYYFVTVNKKYLYFETFSDNGSSKPNLVLYIDYVDTNLHKTISDYFNKNEIHQNFKLQQSNRNKEVCMIVDNFKEHDFESGKGDEYPITKMEAESIVNRYLDFFNDKFEANLTYKKEFLRPFFYQLDSTELIYWKEKHPEITNHNFKY